MFKKYSFSGTLEYGNDASRLWYEEFISNAGGVSPNVHFSNRNGLSYIVLFDDESQKTGSYFEKSRLVKMRKDDLIDLYCQFYGLQCIGYFDVRNKSDLIDDLMCITCERYYSTHFDECEWRDLDGDFIVRGYCQGDSVAVKIHGKNKHGWTKEILQNIFYDTPLGGVIEITCDSNDVADLYTSDIYLSDFIDDPYTTWDNYKKSALISRMCEAHKYEPYVVQLRRYLEDTLPNDYSEVKSSY